MSNPQWVNSQQFIWHPRIHLVWWFSWEAARSNKASPRFQTYWVRNKRRNLDWLDIVLCFQQMLNSYCHYSDTSAQNLLWFLWIFRSLICKLHYIFNFKLLASTNIWLPFHHYFFHKYIKIKLALVCIFVSLSATLSHSWKVRYLFSLAPNCSLQYFSTVLLCNHRSFAAHPIRLYLSSLLSSTLLC